MPQLRRGRSLSETGVNIREALSLFEEDFGGKADEVVREAVFDEEIRLPRKLRSAVQRFQKSRAQAEKLRAESFDAARAVAENLSLRDAGELLGLSHQGVRKILKAG